MTEVVQPLNFEYLFVNILAEGWEIFYFLAFILFAFLAAKFKMPNGVFLLLMFVFVIFIASFYAELWALAVLLAAFFMFFAFKKIVGAK